MAGSVGEDLRRRPRTWTSNPLGCISLVLWVVGAWLWIHYFWPGPRIARNVALGVLWTSAAFGIAGLFWPRYRHKRAAVLGIFLALVSIVWCHLEVLAVWASWYTPCASNVRQIGQALFRYADAHNGRLPDTLDELVTAGHLDVTVLTCPGTWDDPVPPHNGVRYVYLGAGKRMRDFGPEDPIVLDASGNHSSEGRNIGFGDGHVDWFVEPGVPKLLAESAARRSTTRPAARTRPAAY